MNTKNSDVFSQEWVTCLVQHYLHVYSTDDSITERTLYDVLRDLGFSQREMMTLRLISELNQSKDADQIQAFLDDALNLVPDNFEVELLSLTSLHDIRAIPSDQALPHTWQEQYQHYQIFREYVYQIIFAGLSAEAAQAYIESELDQLPAPTASPIEDHALDPEPPDMIEEAAEFENDFDEFYDESELDFSPDDPAFMQGELSALAPYEDDDGYTEVAKTISYLDEIAYPETDYTVSKQTIEASPLEAAEPEAEAEESAAPNPQLSLFDFDALDSNPPPKPKKSGRSKSAKSAKPDVDDKPDDKPQQRSWLD